MSVVSLCDSAFCDGLAERIYSAWAHCRIPGRKKLEFCLLDESAESGGALPHIVGKGIREIDWQSIGYSDCDFIMDICSNDIRVFYLGAIAYFLAVKTENSSVSEKLENIVVTLVDSDSDGICRFLTEKQKLCLIELMKGIEHAAKTTSNLKNDCGSDGDAKH